MPERTEYAPGTPSWVDLQTSDQAAAKEFYKNLLGWEGFDDQEMPDTGGQTYSLAKHKGRDVAAIAPLPPQQGIPPHWNTYVTVADVDATVGQVPNAGGNVVMPAMDVMDAGRMAVVADPTGAMIAIWQAKNHIGAGLVNEPGAYTWNELHTPDVAKAGAFYAKVFGWEPQVFAEMGDYTVFNLEGNGIAGGTKPQMEGVPPNWLVYFEVGDTDKTAAKAQELGATILAPPMDIPTVGRFSVIMDPQGAVFAIIKSESQS